MTGQFIRRYSKFAAFLVFVMGAAGSARAADQSTVGTEEKPTAEIVLHFPVDRSMGTLYSSLPGEEGRELDAIGEVRVPAGSRLTLTVSQPAFDGLSPLAGPVRQGLKQLYFRDLVIQPGTIEQLSALDGVESLSFTSTEVTDRELAQLAKLATLKELSLFVAPVSDAGVASLENLPLERLHLYGTKVTDRVWKTVAKLKSLKDLRLGDKTISDVGFKYFKELPELEYLMFDNLDEVSDEAMGHLATLKKLKALRFFGRGIRLNDAALAHLSKLVSLEELDLSNAIVSDEGFASLVPLKSLKGLRLPDGITDTGMAHVGELASLTRISCTCDSVTDAGLAEIAKLPKLEFLNLSCDDVSDEGMRSLAQATTLEGLFLQHCEVGDEGLAALAPLKSLNWLLISSTEITSDGLRHLAQFPALTNLSIQDLAGGDSSLAHLTNLTQLKSLELSNINRDGAPFDESELEYLVSMTRLTRLKLDNFALTDSGAQRVAALELLESFQYLADDSQMTDAALAHFAAMGNLRRLMVRGNFTDAGLEALATSRSLRRVRIESDTLSEVAIAKLRRVMSVEVPKPWRGFDRTVELFKRRGVLSTALASARSEARREFTRLLLVFGDPDSALTKRLVRIFDHPDVHAALGNYESLAVSPDEKAALAKLVDVSQEALGKIRTPSLVVVDESGRALANEKFALSGDEEFIEPKPLIDFLEHHKPRFDAELMLAAALARASQENKRVFLKQTGAHNTRCRRMSEFIERHAVFFNAEYVIASIDAARFDNGRAVMRRYRPEGGSIPWVAILDANGNVLVTSDSPGGPIGFPADEGSIGYFMHMLGSTVQRSTPEQLQQIRQTLRQRARRN